LIAKRFAPTGGQQGEGGLAGEEAGHDRFLAGSEVFVAKVFFEGGLGFGEGFGEGLGSE
jgi:hypothetical protein